MPLRSTDVVVSLSLSFKRSSRGAHCTSILIYVLHTESAETTKKEQTVYYSRHSLKNFRVFRRVFHCGTRIRTYCVPDISRDLGLGTSEDHLGIQDCTNRIQGFFLLRVCMYDPGFEARGTYANSSPRHGTRVDDHLPRWFPVLFFLFLCAFRRRTELNRVWLPLFVFLFVPGSFLESEHIVFLTA